MRSAARSANSRSSRAWQRDLLYSARKRRGPLALCRGVERARQVDDVERRAVVVPVDVVGGLELDGPGAVPALKAVADELTGIGGTFGRERLDNVEDSPVSRCPSRRAGGR